MRLVTFEIENSDGPAHRLGLWRPPRVLDLNAAYASLLRRKEDPEFARRLAAAVLPPDMLDYIRAGERGRDAAREVEAVWIAEGDIPGPDAKRTAYAEGQVKFLAPLPRPNTIRDFSTFEEHQRRVTRAKGSSEVPAVWYEIPVYWKANPENVVGTDAEVIWPRYTERLDFELEFGIFIGRRGKDISEAEASDFIAGYTVFNDISARDRQAQEVVMTFGPAKGKDFDTSKVLGPCLVTPDEFEGSNHRMTARINGEVWSEGWTDDMHWSFSQLISYVSQAETLMPGDFFGSGACPTGCGLELDRWIQPGDSVEVAVEGIGALRNRIVKR
jgi:2-keto-4-pentenoate hydratase/2-oxohepta-3-ene-1,7-dioic acid hydratase in catechol pathway